MFSYLIKSMASRSSVRCLASNGIEKGRTEKANDTRTLSVAFIDADKFELVSLELAHDWKISKA